MLLTFYVPYGFNRNISKFLLDKIKNFFALTNMVSFATSCYVIKCCTYMGRGEKMGECGGGRPHPALPEKFKVPINHAIIFQPIEPRLQS